MALDVCGNKRFVPKVTCVTAPHIPSPKCRIVMNKPQILVMLVDISKSALVLPLIPRGYEMNTNLLLDRRIVMQGLGDVGYRTPHKNIQRPFVVFPRAINDPAGAFGFFAVSFLGGGIDCTLFRDCSEILRCRVSGRICHQPGVVFSIDIDSLEYVFRSALLGRRRDQTLGIK